MLIYVHEYGVNVIDCLTFGQIHSSFELTNVIKNIKYSSLVIKFNTVIKLIASREAIANLNSLYSPIQITVTSDIGNIGD